MVPAAPRLILLLPLSLLVWSGCARQSPDPSPSPTPPPSAAGPSTATARATTFQLDLPPLEERSPPPELPADWLHHPPYTLTPDELTTQFLATEFSATRGGAAARTQFAAMLEALDPALLAGQTPERLKQRATDFYLAHLGSGDRPARYNAASSALATVLQEGSWQCHSGTLLYFLAALRLPPDAIRAHHFVFIFERGHVLPGYLRRANDQWHLMGLEMTVLGAGRKYYGPTTQLANAGFALRIVMAPEALTLQAIGPYLANGSTAAVHVLRRTAERYDIPLADLERNVRAFAADTSDTPPSGQALIAPWSFGVVEVPPGDRPMMRCERLDPRNNRLSFSQVLAILPEDARSDMPEWNREAPTPPPAVRQTDRTESSDEESSEAPLEEGDGGRIVYPWEADYPQN